MKPSKGVSNLEPAVKLPPKKPPTSMKPNGTVGGNKTTNVPQNSINVPQNSTNVPQNSTSVSKNSINVPQNSTTNIPPNSSAPGPRNSLVGPRGASGVSAAKFIETLQRRREFVRRLREAREKAGG